MSTCSSGNGIGAGVERLLRQAQQDRRVLADRVEHHRPLELGHDLADDVRCSRLRARADDPAAAVVGGGPRFVGDVLVSGQGPVTRPLASGRLQRPNCRPGNPLVSAFRNSRARTRNTKRRSIVFEEAFREGQRRAGEPGSEELTRKRRSHRQVAGTVQVQRHEVERQRRQQQAGKNIMPSAATVACPAPGLSTRGVRPGSRLRAQGSGKTLE